MFLGQIEPVKGIKLNGATGSIPIVGRGTLKLVFKDDNGGCGVRIQHYHCDNGIFADKTFKAACAAAHQTFCGVNARHQNGKAEKRIRDLRDSA